MFGIKWLKSLKSDKTDNTEDQVSDIKITGTKCYVDIEYDNNIVRFGGEMECNGFGADIDDMMWIRHRGEITGNELDEIVEKVKIHNKHTKGMKIVFYRQDGSEY